MSKIEGHKGLLRDDNNMSIINTDTNALLKSRARKAQHIKQNSEINTLKREVRETKELLLKISEKLQWQEQ